MTIEFSVPAPVSTELGSFFDKRKPNATWRKLISQHMREHGESFDDMVDCTLDDDGLDVEFYSGFGGAQGAPFTLWTHKRVYFPVVYDGAEWVGSVPRTPCDEATEHVGGE